MLILQVKYMVKPGLRQEFHDALVGEGLDQKSLAEDGCCRYEYVNDEEEENVLWLHEVWESPEKQKIHCGTPHFQRIGELKAQYVADTEIQRDEVDADAMEDNLGTGR